MGVHKSTIYYWDNQMKETVHNCIKHIFAKTAPIESLKRMCKLNIMKHAPIAKAYI